jgi:hypothetical protein
MKKLILLILLILPYIALPQSQFNLGVSVPTGQVISIGGVAVSAVGRTGLTGVTGVTGVDGNTGSTGASGITGALSADTITITDYFETNILTVGKTTTSTLDSNMLTTGGGHIDKAIDTVLNRNYIVLTTDYILLDSTGADNDTLTLPANPVNGQHYKIKKYDSGIGETKVKGNGHNIDGATYSTIAVQYASIDIYFVASKNEWFIF